MAASKDTAAEKIMPAADLKPLLTKSKKEPLSAAIALTTDEEGIILLDKKKKPKGVRSLLLKEAAKNKVSLNKQSIRFGRAEVDTDYDAGMVRFFIDKEAPGKMRQKLVEVVKQISYSKVELNVDLALEAEPEEEEEQETEGLDGAPGEPEPPPPPVTPTLDLNADALTKELAGLIRRIPEAARAGAEVMDKLKKLATLGNVNIKTNNLKTASAQIKELATALAEALDGLGVGIGQVAPPTQPSGGSPIDKSRQIWIGVHKKLVSNIEEVRSKVLETYQDSPMLGAIGTGYAQRVQKPLEPLEESLAVQLGEVDAATDPVQRKAKLQAAADTLAKYTQIVQTHGTVINEIDTNPFVKVAPILPTLTETLKKLTAVVNPG